MILNYILILLISLLINYVIYKSVLTINILYTATWVIAGILNLINFAGLYTAGSNIHKYIMTSIITFNIVYWIFSRKKKQKIKLEEFNFNLQLKWLVRINLCCQAFMIPFLIKAIRIIRTTSFSNLRKYAYVGSDVFASTLESRIISWIILPVFFSSIIIVITLVLLKKSTIWLNLMIITDMFLYTITLGGKMLIVLSVLFYVFGYILLKISLLDKKVIKIDKRYYLILVFIITYLVYVTKLRALKGLNVIQNFVVYLYGGLSYFDAILNSGKYLFLNSYELQGSATFGFIITPILYLKHHIFGGFNINAEYLTKIVTSNYEYVSRSYKFNSLATALYYFWRDFNGVPGIIFGTFCMCLFYIYVENKYYDNKNVRWFSLYIFLTMTVFLSTQTYWLYDIQSFMKLLFIMILTSNILWNRIDTCIHKSAVYVTYKNAISNIRKLFH